MENLYPDTGATVWNAHRCLFVQPGSRDFNQDQKVPTAEGQSPANIVIHLLQWGSYENENGNEITITGEI